METTVLGYPRIGAQRELKKATEAYWAGRETAAGLEQTAAALRRQTWETLRDAGLTGIPSNTFSLYDHVLDTAVMVNAVPERFAGAGRPGRLLRDGPRRRGGRAAGADQVVRHQLPLPGARARARQPTCGWPGTSRSGSTGRRGRSASRPGRCCSARCRSCCCPSRPSRASRPLTCSIRCWTRTSSCSGSCTRRAPGGCSWTSRSWPPTGPRPSSRRSAAPTSGSGRSATGRRCW